MRPLAWLAVIAAVVVAGGLITWAVISQNDWNHRCARADGTVEERFEGFITVLVGNPPMPNLIPNYSYHCWRDGQEIEP